MGNMNFQDEQSDKPEQKQPMSSAESNPDEPKVEDIFVDEPTSGSKFLWVAIVVIIVAGIGGGLYLLNRHGYLKFGQKPITEAPTPLSAVPADTSKAIQHVPAVKEEMKEAVKVGSERFALQVSAFRTKPQADRYVATLKKRGIDAYVFKEGVAEDGKWFKVCVGSFDTKLRAIAAIHDMKKKVGTDVWVIPVQ